MKKIWFQICLLIMTGSISGQIEEMIIPSDLKQQTVITEPATLRKGFFRIGTINSYGTVDRIFDESGKRTYIMGSNGWATAWTHEADLSYGITDRLQVSAQLPYERKKTFFSSEIILPGFDTSQIHSVNSKGNGIGDISVAASYQILKEEDRKPSLLAKIFLTLPTGRKNPTNVVNSRDFNMPTGNGETTIDFRLQFRKIFYQYSVTVYTSYLYHFKAKKIFNPGEEEISFRSGDMVYFGSSYNVHLNDWIALLNEVACYKWFDDKFYGSTTYDQGITGRWGIFYQPALVFQVRRFRFFEVIQFPLKGKFISADPVYTLGLQYTL